jgi:hypothetical protein
MPLNAMFSKAPKTSVCGGFGKRQSAAKLRGVAGVVLRGFLADAAAVLRTVPSPNSSCSPIEAHE